MLKIDTWHTTTEELNEAKVVDILRNQATYHAVTGEDVFETKAGEIIDSFTVNNRYSSEVFQGIMLDTGASGVSTAGEAQYLAL
jgi:hypothetical protein